MKNALSEALQSGDFKNLNDLVSQTVADAINEVGKEVGKYVPLNNTKNQQSSQGEPGPFQEQQTSPPPDMPIWQIRAQERERQRQLKLQQEWQKQQQRRQEQEQQRQEQAQRAPQVLRKNLPAIKVKKVGSVSNVLYQVFGGIGLLQKVASEGAGIVAEIAAEAAPDVMEKTLISIMNNEENKYRLLQMAEQVLEERGICVRLKNFVFVQEENFDLQEDTAGKIVEERGSSERKIVLSPELEEGLLDAVAGYLKSLVKE